MPRKVFIITAPGVSLTPAQMACGTKRPFPTRHAAMVAVRRIDKHDDKYGRRLRAYRCDQCGHYHVGHENNQQEV